MVYYLTNLIGYCMPYVLFRFRRERILKKALLRDDIDYIKFRVDYYCKLSQGDAQSEFERWVGSFKFKKEMRKHSVYFFDTYTVMRWFEKDLGFNLRVGDVTKLPEVPSFSKSRPIGEGNKNLTLLKMGKVRHFNFLRDNIAFKDKENKAIFRLAINNRPHRERFMQLYADSDFCDAGIVSANKKYPTSWVKNKVSMYNHLIFKFIIALEGHDVATNLKWVMSTNSVAVMPRPKYETWFMEGTLVADYHYVEIKDDYSDLKEKMDYYAQHVDEAQKIIDNAHKFVEQFKNKKREKIISLLVAKKYFEQTNKK